MTTRDKLLEAAAVALAEDGVAGVSARTVAARAEVNQALVFYHFGTVDELLEAAVRRSVDLAVATYRDRSADVTSLADLLTLGRDLHRTEQERGNVGTDGPGDGRSTAQPGPGLGREVRHGPVERRGRVRRRSGCCRGPCWPGSSTRVGSPRPSQPGSSGSSSTTASTRMLPPVRWASLDAIGAMVAAFDALPPMAVRAVRSRARKAVARAAAAQGEGR